MNFVFIFVFRIMRAALVIAAMAAGGLASAQSFPSGPIRIINTFPPGGPSDIISRLIAEKMEKTLKQPVVVENKPGAGGNIGAEQVARAAPDGQTIMSGIDTTFTINPEIYKSMPFKPEDLKPLMIMASSGLMVGVNPSLGVKTLDELIAKGKGMPLNFSSGSNGSPGHIAAEILGQSTGIKITHIPYKGNSPAVMAVISGQVDGGILATPGLMPHVLAGKAVPLAVTSRKRSQLAPDVPTTAEAGQKELLVEVLYLAMVPAATPPATMAVLQKAMSDALDQTDVKETLARLDLFVEKKTGKEAEEVLSTQRERYARIIKSTGMKVE